MGIFLGDSDSNADTFAESIDPVWTIDLENENELVQWDKRTSDYLLEKNRVRNAVARENVIRYRGMYSSIEPTIGGAMQLTQQRSQFPKIVVNHSQDLVEQKIANQLKYKPNFDVTPDSGELSDKQDSIVVKRLLDSINYWSGLPKQYHKVLRHSILAGQGWIYIYWDKCIGKTTKKTEKIKLFMKDGSTSEVESPVKVGDVAYKIIPDWSVFTFPADSVEDCPGLMWQYEIHTDELKTLHPDKAHLIIPGAQVYSWNWNSLEDEPKKNHSIVREYFFKSSKYLPGGLHLKFTEDVLLQEPEEIDIPCEYIEQDPMGNLPFARLTDVDVEGEVDGYPSFSFISQLQHIFDKWITLCHKNVFLFCHPKYIYPRNSVDPQQLSNGSYGVGYTGPVAPQFQTYQALTQDLLKFGDIILGNMEKVMRIYGISRGNPPPGTRAAASLYFYDEQEQTANGVYKRKFEDFTVRVESLKLGLVSKYYGETPKRLIWTLGRSDEWIAESVDTKKLAKKYTVRIRSASNLPDSKFARIQALLDIAQQFPNAVTQEHIAEMLDFGQQEKFLDYARVSIMAAEGENERLMAGEKIPSAENFEYQIGHWKTHVRLAQDPNFRNQSAELQRHVKDHIMGHEAIMIELSKNPYYKQQLLSLAQFPLFASLPPAMPGEAPLPGAGLPVPETGVPQESPARRSAGGDRGAGLAKSLTAGDGIEQQPPT